MARLDRWLLLLYSLPAHPSRGRVRVWRELRRAGAVTPRDGVCALPDGPRAREWAARLRSLVADFGGSASIAQEARLDSETTAALKAQIVSARAEELVDIAAAADGLLVYLNELRGHFTPGADAEAQLRADLARLRSWLSQAVERDDLGLANTTTAEHAIESCERALADLAPERPDAVAERSA